jgi:hypothetical protein
MRITILLLLFFTTSRLEASDSKIPRNIRGLYSCEMPAYKIQHDTTLTKVESITALLFVYKSHVVLNVGGKSFTSSVEKRKPANKRRDFLVTFDSPLGSCVISFSRREKTATLDLPLFNNLVFNKTKRGRLESK